MSTNADLRIMHPSVHNGLRHGILSAMHSLMTDAAKVSDTPLARMSDDEVALMYHVGMYGSRAYPVERIGRRWHWRAWRSVSGSPKTFRTKGQAVAAFECWMDLARARWAQMKQEEPGIISTAVG